LPTTSASSFDGIPDSPSLSSVVGRMNMMTEEDEGTAAVDAEVGGASAASAASSSSRSPPPSPRPPISPDLSTAASTLSNLASLVASYRVSSPPSSTSPPAAPSPSSSSTPPPSAGPLKKRRKVKEEGEGEEGEERERREEDEDHDHATRDDAMTPVEEDGAVVDSDRAADDGGRGRGGVIHFPSVLHELLTRGERAGDEAADDVAGTSGRKRTSGVASAMEWLPHGRGFRVLRWDEMCAGVLPVEFPALCEYAKDGMTRMRTRTRGATSTTTRGGDRNDYGGGDEDATTAAASEGGNPNDFTREKKGGVHSEDEWIDSFLWHVRAWGFQEVTTGVDRGSFRHEVRDSPNVHPERAIFRQFLCCISLMSFAFFFLLISYL
jgi:hypothetical protein